MQLPENLPGVDNLVSSPVGQVLIFAAIYWTVSGLIAFARFVCRPKPPPKLTELYREGKLFIAKPKGQFRIYLDTADGPQDLWGETGCGLAKHVEVLKQYAGL